MKVFIAILLVLSGSFLLAQPVVLDQSSQEAAGLRRKLEKEYSNENNISETPYSILHQFQNACAQLANERYASLLVRGAAFVNEQGKADYLLISVVEQYVLQGKTPTPKTVLDSLTTVLTRQLQPFAQQLVSRRTVGKKAAVNVYAGLHVTQPKAVIQRDSVVNTLEGLAATKDTLKVKHIHLGRSLLTAIPESIYRFPNLETLLLNDNDIEWVNLDLSRLPKLRQVDLTSNLVREDKIKLSKNKSLKMLTLLKNDLQDIPRAVRNCKGLETLWLGSNGMRKLSNKSFKRAKPVKDLNFYKTGIAVLPKGIRKLKRLEVLDLYYNKLEALPKSITKLRNLTHLAVAHNELGALPERMDKLAKVHTLYAHHNHISKLPESIAKMQNLKILDLGYNWFTQFPEPLTSFVNLQELDLSSNNFPDFPEQLLKIRKLDKLYLRGNPFIKADAETKYSQQLTALKNKNIEVFY